MASKILRIYLPISAKVKGERSFWQKLFGSSLGGHLAKEAKAFGIEQALIQRTFAGYLKGQNLAYDISEVTPENFPQCIELLDSEERLRAFIDKERLQLLGCRAYLFQTAELVAT